MKNKNLLEKNTYYIISKMLEKIGVGEEYDDDDNEIKYFYSTATINNLAEKLYNKSISENDFLLSLKFLNTTDENCKYILSQIKKEIFPLLKPEELSATEEKILELENIAIPKTIKKGTQKIKNNNDAYRESIE